MKIKEDVTDYSSIAVTTILIISALAWLTHIITSLNEGWWGFLIAGALFFPIGVIHGVMLWVGLL
jgi:hypothetical protein